MRSSARNTKRFLGPPKELTPDTMVMGFTAAQWHQKLTSGWADEMAIVRERVERLKREGFDFTLPTGQESQHVASYFSKSRKP